MPYKVTKVTTTSYPGYYFKPKMAKNGPKLQNKVFFARRESSSLVIHKKKNEINCIVNIVTKYLILHKNKIFHLVWS